MADTDADNHKTRVPPHASPEAAKFWKESWFKRALRFTKPGNDELIQSMFGVLAQSFSMAEFEYAITTGYDLSSEVRRRYLDNRFSKRIARAVIRNQWTSIHTYLMQPRMCRELIRSADPQKAALLDTPQGWEYFCWLTFHMLVMLRDKGEIDDAPIYRPPRGICPLHHGLCMRPAPSAGLASPEPNP